MHTSEIRTRLHELYVEQIEAESVGLAGSAPYMDDLRKEIREMRAAFVGAAVTEIAMLRAELSGRLVG